MSCHFSLWSSRLFGAIAFCSGANRMWGTREEIHIFRTFSVYVMVVFKPGCLQFLRRCALLHSSVPFCVLLRSFVSLRLRSFALFCAHAHSFVRICVFLRPTVFRATASGNFRCSAAMNKLSSGDFDKGPSSLASLISKSAGDFWKLLASHTPGSFRHLSRL